MVRIKDEKDIIFTFRASFIEKLERKLELKKIKQKCKTKKMNGAITRQKRVGGSKQAIL